MRVWVARVPAYDLAGGVERLDFDFCVWVGQRVQACVVGEGPVCGRQRGGGAGDEGTEREVVEDFAAVSGGFSVWLMGG